ncbi:MAG: hypothetical protein LQ352_003288 [Teloschistes flavicans]|nr:MAG: hypothetical protein LQ352_003288 [Teloschistes flavicans]
MVQVERYLYHIEGITDVADLSNIIAEAWRPHPHSESAPLRHLLGESCLFADWLIQQQSEPYQASAQRLHREFAKTKESLEKCLQEVSDCSAVKGVDEVKRERDIANFIRLQYPGNITPDRWRAGAREPIEKYFSEIRLAKSKASEIRLVKSKADAVRHRKELEALVKTSKFDEKNTTTSTVLWVLSVPMPTAPAAGFSYCN